MMPSWLLALLVAVIAGGLPGWQAARGSRRVKKLEDADRKRVAEEKERRDDERDRDHHFELAQRINTEAFERAQRINNEIVAGLRDEIARLRTELNDVREQAIGAERRNLDVERKYAAMERSLLRMETLVKLYVKQLRDAGIDVAELPAEGNRAE
jgi:signal transduction histidine kinase